MEKLNTDLDRYRSLFPITQNYVYLNHAAVGAPSVRVTDTLDSLAKACSQQGLVHYPEWMARIESVRALFAALIHANADEIAFTGNTSQGISAITSGLRWKKGDCVIVPKPEFPANVYPWLNLERYGVHVVWTQRKNGRITIKDLQNVIKPKTRLVSVSSADYLTGFRSDLDEVGDFCQKKGLLFCVDAIQTLGAVPLDVKKSKIHFLAAGGHKWLLSTMGCGALFISKEVNDQVHPEQVGWKSVRNQEDFLRLTFDLKPDARRFEAGTMNLLGIYALGAAIELLLEVGITNILKKIKKINDMFYNGLKNRGLAVQSAMDENERSGILSFIPRGAPVTLHRNLMKNKVMVSERGGMIRLSPHFYNNEDDVQRFFEVFDEV